MEAERISLNEQLEYEKPLSQPLVIEASMDILKRFKAVIQSVIEKEISDGERLEIVPGYPQITGVKMVSPRGSHVIPTLCTESKVTLPSLIKPNS